MSPKKKQPREQQKGLQTTPLILLIVLCFLIYSSALKGGFVWDDELQIVKNWQIRDIRYVPSAFGSAFWTFADPEAGARTNFYRPVQTLGYIVAYQIGGLSPWPYHLINVLFHVFASILVYLICLELRISPTAAVLGAAIFATHPIHTEPVAWAAGTPDASCGFFYFASLLFLLKFLKSGKREWQWLSALAFLAACFSKEMAVTLPVVAVLLMFTDGRFGPGQFKKALTGIAPLIIAGVIYLAVRVAALGFISTTHLAIEAGPLDWFTLGLRVFGQYIQYSLLPYPLLAYHLIPLHLPDRIASTMLYALLAALAAFIAFKLNRKISGIGVWSVIFAVTLIPVFNFTGISLTFFAERYLYIPTISLAIIAGLLLDKAGKNARVAAVGIVIVFGVYTFIRNQDWNTDEKLYTSILRVQPEVAHIRNNLADIYLKRGEDDLAKTNLETALRSLQSDVYPQAVTEKYRAEVGLGALAARGQRYAEAKDHLKQALEINPRGDWAYLYLGGVVMEGDGNYEMAMELFKKAIELGPVNEVARDYMGVALFNMKRYKEAVPYFQEALKINPTYKDAQTHLEMTNKALAS